MTVVTICSDFGAQENKICRCFDCFPIYLPWSDGTGCHDLSFLNVEFYASFFTPLSYSSRGSSVPLHILPSGWCHLHIWGYWYLLTILIPPCATSSPAFCMMCSAYKLNKQGDNIQPWHIPFPTWNQSIVLSLVLNVAIFKINNQHCYIWNE